MEAGADSMLTLKQAMGICHIRDDEAVYLRPNRASRFYSERYLGKEIRNKFDMKKIIVVGISIHFSWGEFEGMEFEIIRRDKSNE